MTSQVIFKLDSKLKSRAMKKAQVEGISFSSILKMATKAFVDGDLKVGIIRDQDFNTKTRRELNGILKDVKAGKNISSRFSTVDEMIRQLES